MGQRRCADPAVVSAIDPRMKLVRSETGRRGGRYPAGAPTVAVDAAHRLRCASRSTLARRNSLHSLRSLRSDNRRESEVNARAERAPRALLRCSPPHKSPPPCTAHRAATLAACIDPCLDSAGKAVGGCAPAATYAAPRSAGLRGLRVALRRRVCHTLFELRAQRRCGSSVAPARGRVCVAALAARAPQGSRSAAQAAAFERRRIPAHGFASLDRLIDLRLGPNIRP